MPNLACAAASALRRQAAPAPAASLGCDAEAGLGSDAASGCCGMLLGEDKPVAEMHAGAAGGGVQPLHVDVREAVYLLNPSGDLPATQAAFEAWFGQQPGWQARALAPQQSSD